MSSSSTDLVNSTYSFYSEKRHEKQKKDKDALQPWRMREKLKTVSVAIVLCLNIGIDPPDQIKTNPCAKLECWIDPFSLPPQKALDAIGRTLQLQYEVWQPRAKYRLSLDPSIDDTKKLCCSLRRNSKDERILFHYGGHGVPRPTAGGEIWVFNKNYTQYIPVSIFDIQTWLGSPCIYVYDCSNAANILHAFNRFANQRDNHSLSKNNTTNDPENVNDPTASATSSSSSSVPNNNNNSQHQHPTTTPMKECIQLAACGANEVLPMQPDLPADLFTCCLTTPIEIALRWFVTQDPLLKKNISKDMISKIPGRLSDRRTPLGELNWIFTSITDTIAWNLLPNDMFKKFFRQDLMVAALFRNFLLASRLMRYYRCHPVSYPELPPTHQHPMWQAWDLAAESCLSQLPGLLAAEDGGPAVEYRHSTFFAEQLTAFEVWLRKGAISKSPPQQLPIVLQVLLSQIYRLRALMLLSRFLDLGPWAVNLALSVGIFPYILKLLQSPAAELKLVLVFIWAKILAVDRSCQADLLKDSGYSYFINILSTNSPVPQIPNISEHQAMCVFILAVFCHNFRNGQAACLKSDLLPALMLHINDMDPLLRQWVCLCLGKFWDGFAEAKSAGLALGAHTKVFQLLNDSTPEVRTAAVYTIGTLIGDNTDESYDLNQNIAMKVLGALKDGSPMARKELVGTLSKFVNVYDVKFGSVAFDLLEERKAGKRVSIAVDSTSEGGSPNFKSPSQNSVYGSVWKVLLILSVDPSPTVSVPASKVVDDVNLKVLSSPLFDASSVASILSDSKTRKEPALPSVPLTPKLEVKNPTLRKSSSFAYSLRNLAGFGSQPSSQHRNSTTDAMEPREGGSALRGSPSSSSLKSFVGLSSSSPAVNAAVSAGAKVPLELETIGDDVNFFDASCEYFAEPQMKVAEVDDPGSVRYIERQWRKERNDKINVKTSQLHTQNCRFDTQYGLLQHEANTSCIVFNQYEPYVVCANDRDTLSVFNWEEGCVKVSSFRNRQAPHAKITSLGFINEDDLPLLTVGCDDGSFRIYRKYAAQVELVTAWNVLTNIPPPVATIHQNSNSQQQQQHQQHPPSARNSIVGSSNSMYNVPSNITTSPTITQHLQGPRKLVSSWLQSVGCFAISGFTKTIKIWDAEREMCVQDISTKSPKYSVTSLCTEKYAGNLIFAGCADGSIRLYDRRIHTNESMVNVFTDHKSQILDLSCKLNGEMISGAKSGDIRIWDIRQAEALRVFDTGFDTSAFAVHETTSLVACAHKGVGVLVYDSLSGRCVGTSVHGSSAIPSSSTSITPSTTNSTTTTTTTTTTTPGHNHQVSSPSSLILFGQGGGGSSGVLNYGASSNLSSSGSNSSIPGGGVGNVDSSSIVRNLAFHPNYHVLGLSTVSSPFVTLLSGS